MKTPHIIKITQADLEACNASELFLQSAMWGRFKSRFNWEAKAFLIEWETEESGTCKSSLLVLTRRMARFFSFAYVPWGPEIECGSAGLCQLVLMLKPFLNRNTVFIRFEPPWDIEKFPAYKSVVRKRAADVQAPDTVIVDLKPEKEELLAAMKPKWRYNISLSEKKNVKVKPGTEQDLDIFYSLMKETAARDRIAIHSFDYYKTLFNICQTSEDGSSLRLYTAVHENDTLAAIVVLFRGKHATYLYGASSDKKRNLMAAYALQWRAMQDAKDAGCLYYDLFGIPPDENPDHPMHGLYRFKTGFGGYVVHRLGAFDFQYKPFLYYFFSKAELLRKYLRDRKKKKGTKT